VALFIYGTMSLAGLPLTPGFAGRWGVITLVAAQSPWLAALLLLAAASSLFGLWRALGAALAPAEEDVPPLPRRDALLAQGIAVTALAGGLLLALFPQILFNLI
jgi:NADH:ubiquinone oxidoreductase subunit 2 (subunit N)